MKDCGGLTVATIAIHKFNQSNIKIMEQKRNSWTIRCGRNLQDERDRVIVHIIATEEEAKVVGATVARFERAVRNKEVCCIAKRNCDNHEILICDCM